VDVGGLAVTTRMVVVSRHVPVRQGTAAGRALLALGDGLRQLGVDLTVHSWGPDEAEQGAPAWCVLHGLRPEARWRSTSRSVRRPVHEVERAGLGPFEADAVLVADDPPSFPAVAGHPRAVLTVHYATSLDRRADRRRPSLRELQLERAERAAVRCAPTVLAYSQRVAAAIGHGAVAVPIATPVPARCEPLPDAPSAAVLGSWGWGPNRLALEVLLDVWPEVRRKVPGATLTIAGPGSEGLRGDGVRGLGRVGAPQEILDEAAVVPFPCPPSSGPKVKSLEALAHGRVLVTTPHGVEGIWGDGTLAAVAPAETFAHRLRAVLADPLALARTAAQGRQAVLDHHAPRAAAHHRLRALGQAVDTDAGGAAP